MPLSVGLHAEQVEPALHGALGDAAVLGHGAHAPMRGVERFAASGRARRCRLPSR